MKRGAGRWLAGALACALFGAASCRSVRAPIPEEGVAHGEPGAEAEALARFAQLMLMRELAPDSDRFPDILKKAVEADPARESFRIWLGHAFLAGGRPVEAVAELEDAARRFPRAEGVHYLLGLAYEAADRRAEARTVYERVRDWAPDKPEAYASLAGLALREGRFGEVFRVLDEALARVADTASILNQFERAGRVFLADGRPQLAAACFRRVVERRPQDTGAREALAVSRLAAGDAAGALAEWDALERQEPDQAVWPHRAGETLEQLNQPARAAEAYERAVARPGAQPETWVRLALLRAAGDDPAAAQETLQACADRFPLEPQPHVIMGALAYGLGRWKDAITAFERAEPLIQRAVRERRQPAFHPGFYFWYGAACEQDGQAVRAEEWLQRAVLARPDHHEALNYLAYLWAERGVNLDRALALSRRSLELNPDEPAYLDTLGWIYFKMNELDKALEFVGRAAAAVEDAVLADHMGDILAAMNRREEAVAWWRRSLARDPKNERVAEKLRAAEGRPAVNGETAP